MSDTLDAIVVGLGAMGSNALAVLARRGKRVLGLDRFDPPHNFGSSHGGSRVIRLSYFEHPDYVPLLKRAYDAFDRLAQDSGETLRIENGLVMGGAPGNAVAAGMLRSARTHDLPVSALDGAELMRRYPQFTVPADWEVVFEARGGFVRPEATIRAALAAAARDGARIERETPIAAWGSDGRTAWVETARGRFEASALILAAGAWMPACTGTRQSGQNPLRLTPTRETLVWIDDEGDPDWHATRMPVWLFDRGNEPAVYGVPAFDLMGAPGGMKVGLHGSGGPVRPEQICEPVEPAIVRKTVQAMQERLRGAAGRRVTGACSCLYTMSKDGHFAVGLHPDHSNVAIAGGFSGHGFKFAPVIGEALADLAIGGETHLPIGFLAPGRLLKNGTF